MDDLKKQGDVAVNKIVQASHGSDPQDIFDGFTCTTRSTLMRWSDDGNEVTMSKEEYETLQSGYAKVVCHCGFETQVFRFSGPGDGGQCAYCGCYFGNSAEDCILEKRKRYPYLQTVVDYINTLPHQQKESYVSLKVGKQFNLTPEQVHDVRVEIALMVWDRQDHPRCVPPPFPLVPEGV